MLYKIVALAALTETVSAAAAPSSPSSVTFPDGVESSQSCYALKKAYQDSTCCNAQLAKETNFQVMPASKIFQGLPNPCAGKKPDMPNKACTVNGVVDALEQAGANVTLGYQGLRDAEGRQPITSTYLEAGLCPVNVHWHLGTEHLSIGQYDEDGKGPSSTARRKLGTSIRAGFQCHHYNKDDAKFTTPFNWQHCTNMEVGQTYEVHWPHSKGGACGTPNQYQTPFYDGVFCDIDKVLPDTHTNIGVQSQTFTIVNDENYYYPDLIRGMIVEGDFGADMAKYTGSTTGTSRNNEMCSQYAAITWQVDRKCHLISASTFDKMCADMKAQRDDMSGDFYPHGSRELVADHLAANNQQRE